MRLSKYFTLEELIASATADHRGIYNNPPIRVLNNLYALARKLDDVRLYLGKPVFVSSGYRCPKLNTAVGGAFNSAHLFGQAADISCPAFGKTMDVFEAVRNSGIKFDQLIAEFPASPTGGWVHIGLGEKNRQQALVFDGKHYSEIR